MNSSQTCTPPAQEATEQSCKVDVVDDSVVVATSFLPKATDLSWDGLSYSVVDKKTKANKTILHPTQGVVVAGHVLAIMGPSGSGKTTLLDSLAGKLGTKGKLQGKVMFNRETVSKSKQRRIMSYVSQEDALHGVFTVRETLKFAARFHYGYSITRTEMDKHIDAIIDNMGLQSCANTVVGDIFRKGLSGGQKRRLSIGVELVSRPAVVLLDEPTSGLDSASAYGVMKELNKLARMGHTIATTIHQPSSEIWSLFDKLMILGTGHTVYFGDASGTTEYFSALGYECPKYTNPADYFISLVNTDFVLSEETTVDLSVLSKQYNESAMASAVRMQLDGKHTDTVDALVLDGDAPLPSEPPATAESSTSLGNAGHGKEGGTWFSSFLTLSHRNILNNIRNPGIFWVRFVMYTMLALMIGLMYLHLGETFTTSSINSRVSLLFFVAAFLVFMSVAVIPFFIQERAYFVRERQNGAYTVSAFVLSNWLCSVPGIALIALFATICVVLPSGINGFGWFFFDLFLSLLTAEAFMCLVSAIVPHYIIGIALGAGVFGFFMLCEGFFIVFPDIPPWFIWGYYIGFHTYSFKVFMFNEFANIAYFDDSRFPDGMAVLEYYGIHDTTDFGRDLGVLFAFGALFQLCFAAVLYKYHTGNR